MSFATALALLITVLVGAPIAAHLLRRRRADERRFAAARLVPATAPQARRRSHLEDRSLFAIRALAIITLAILGATPLVRCSHFALTRKAGASVALAIVMDDSLSMRAPVAGSTTTRFDRALKAARELTEGLASGDAAAVVLAGAPPRIAVASTIHLAAIDEALKNMVASDRATDLDGAITMAQSLLKGLPHADKRVVVLSDLADGNHGGPPIGGGDDTILWVPLPELEAQGSDCGVVRADRVGSKARVRVVCTRYPTEGASDVSASKDRVLEVRAGNTVLSKQRLEADLSAADFALDLPAEAPEMLLAALTGSDAIADDDHAPVISTGGPPSIAVVVDAASTHVATGGAPPVEQALAALETDVMIRPLPSVPEHSGELDAHVGLIVDDASGFTPEVRRAIAAWMQRGGVALLTLGPRAAAAPLGASFEPLVPGVIRWDRTDAVGIDPATAPLLGPSALGLKNLDPSGRAMLDQTATAEAEVLGRWSDGAPFLIRRTLGRGNVWILTLPFSTDQSDLALRPAFLALLDRFVTSVRSGIRRIDAGQNWTFDGYKSIRVDRVEIDNPDRRTSLPVIESDRRPTVSPSLAGLYEVSLDDEKVMRVVSIPEREIDFRPRRVLDSARGLQMGGPQAAMDVSPYVALALLGMLLGELILRIRARNKE